MFPYRTVGFSTTHRLSRAATALITVALSGCGLVEIGGGEVLQSVTRFTRGLAPAPYRATPSPSGTSECSPGFLCLTPTNLEGRVYTASLMVGGNGEGSGYAITTVGATEDVRRRPDLGKDGTLTFNLNETTDFSGDYTGCGGSSYPADSVAIVRRLEFAWDYVDATFTVPNGAGPDIAGTTHAIRLVYVEDTDVTDVLPDTTATIMVGDKLVRSGSDSTFSWCDETACGWSQRPQSPLADTAVTLNTGEGNQSYAIFAVNFAQGNSVTFTQDEALQGNWIFTVEFHLENALRFRLDNWSEVQSLADLVEAFTHFADHREGNTSVEVTLSKAPMEMAPRTVGR